MVWAVDNYRLLSLMPGLLQDAESALTRLVTVTAAKEMISTISLSAVFSWLPRIIETGKIRLACSSLVDIS